MVSVDKKLGVSALIVALVGAFWGLVVVFAEGMANAPGPTRSQAYIALPIPIGAASLALLGGFLAYRNGTLRARFPLLISALVIAAGTLVLATAELLTYAPGP